MFLRILEYYAGILFLTTNRIGVIDDAFRSRLHLALYYPILDLDQTKRIWKMNMDRVKRYSDERVENGGSAIEIDRKGIRRFGKRTFDVLKWNGRQIKNAFQSALALAEMEAQQNDKGSPKLDERQFTKIARASEQFEYYMMETHHGKTEEQLAHREQTRFAMKKPFKGRIGELYSDEETSESEQNLAHKRSKKSSAKSKAKKHATEQGSSSSEGDGGETVEKTKSKGKKVRDSDSSDEGEVRHGKSNRKKSRRPDFTDSSEEY